MISSAIADHAWRFAARVQTHYLRGRDGDGKGRWEGGRAAGYRMYPAIDRPRQRPFPSHPKGRVIRAPWCVETLKRGIHPDFRASPATASRITLSRSS